MRALIIEDERPAARRLEQLLQATTHDIDVQAVIDSVEAATAWLRTYPMPELIFMDIQLADGLSFDIFEQVEVRCPVIFTTAYDQYALQAFQVSGIDYLLKPINPDDLARALTKYETLRGQQQSIDAVALQRMVAQLQQPTYKSRFLVKSGEELHQILTDDIAYFRSTQGITWAHLHSGKRYGVDFTLDQLGEVLDPSAFYRINRQMMIGERAIERIHTYFNHRLKLTLRPDLDEDVIVSRDRVTDFKAWLGR